MRAKFIAFMLVLICLVSSAAFADKAITGINVVNKTDRVIISIQGNSALKMTPLVSPSGRYVGFQFPCKLIAKGGLVGIRSGRIYNVRYSNFTANPPRTRVVANTRSHVQYSTSWAGDKSRVEITIWKNGIPKATSAKSQAAYPLTPDASSAVSSITNITTTRAKTQVRKDMPAPLVSACTKAMPIPSARPAAPVAKVLGLTEVAEAPSVSVSIPVSSIPKDFRPRFSDEPKKIARADSGGNGRVAAASEKRVSLNFLGADINDVLKALSVQSGHNIVASKDVTGNVTVSLSDVTVDSALDYVAKLSGYAYTKEGGTYLVASKDSLKTLTSGNNGDPTTEVIKLSYAMADDVIDLVKNRYPNLQISKIGVERTARVGLSNNAGDSSIALRNNLLVLTGTESEVEAAKSLIEQFEDTLKVQVVESKRAIYKVKYVNAKELASAIAVLIPGIGITFAPTEGFDLAGPKSIKVNDSGSAVTQDESNKIQKEQNASQQASDQIGLMGVTGSQAGTSSKLVSIETRTRPLAIVITGRELDVEKALQLAKELDIKSPQIKIEAKITSISKTGEQQLGLDWSWDEISFTESPRNTWTRNATNFSATLDALITNGDATVLASPNLLCLDGKPGVFFVGDEVTYVSSVSSSSSGEKTYNTSTVQAGVQLRLVGSVNPDGYITLNLHPEVSTVTLTTEDSVTLPTVNRRFTDHVVRVKDGSTIAIGGLIREDEVESMSKIPLLGDLPFFGKLFRHKETSHDKNEVVMFITASSFND
ncbi:secretin and TonB N-terminal domain-containing protein [bacterium]|nr:secretin and TonB N-terminal domain-containing protein [bacterium]